MPVNVDRFDNVNHFGRHVEHDTRSYKYAMEVLPRRALQAVDWAKRIPVLDQGNLGSCTGFALAALIGTDSRSRAAKTSMQTKSGDPYNIFKANTAYTIDYTSATNLYKLNTRLDDIRGDYPPTDTGSSALGMGKCAQTLGLIESYKHAFTMQAVKTALQDGPVGLGTVWYNSMMDTQSNGYLKVDAGSGVAGGHELVISAWNGKTDVAASAFRLDNSWGRSWGINGSAWLTEANLQALLNQDGDVLVPVFASVAPAPTPAPTPEPTPAPAPQPDADVKAAYDSLIKWAKRNNL